MRFIPVATDQLPFTWTLTGANPIAVEVKVEFSGSVSRLDREHAKVIAESGEWCSGEFCDDPIALQTDALLLGRVTIRNWQGVLVYLLVGISECGGTRLIALQDIEIQVEVRDFPNPQTAAEEMIAFVKGLGDVTVR